MVKEGKKPFHLKKCMLNLVQVIAHIRISLYVMCKCGSIFCKFWADVRHGNTGSQYSQTSEKHIYNILN